MSGVLRGAAAGCAATLPMTVVMTYLHRRLPEGERTALPPRQITHDLATETGVHDALKPDEELALTFAGHFAYGAAAGALFAPIARALPLPPLLLGPAYGLAVWAGSYYGLLPALGIAGSASGQTLRSNALMAVSHLAWGAALGAIYRATSPREG